jgi:hypothetical protein
LFLDHDGDLPFEIVKVFLCPPHSFAATVERMLEIIDHSAIP